MYTDASSRSAGRSGAIDQPGQRCLPEALAQLRRAGVMLVRFEYSGAGIGTKVADGVFALIRKNGQNVVPQCEFMARYAARHPEYNDLITG